MLCLVRDTLQLDGFQRCIISINIQDVPCWNRAMLKTAQKPEENDREVPLGRGLSTKLLLLTILFVLVAEVFIAIPSIASFGREWMEQRLRTAAAVAIVVMESGPDSLSLQASNRVLIAAGTRAIAVRDEGVARMLVVSEVPPEVDQHIDLDALGFFGSVQYAFDTLLFGGSRVLRVFGRIGEPNTQYEIVLADWGLRAALLDYARNIALLSLGLSLFTAMLVFYAINRIMIRPIRRMIRSMLAFGGAPDDATRIIEANNRRDDEIGIAERELADMQTTLHRTLGERRRLADLGLAVSKINHDMRNMLAAAQLMSDRLAEVNDPAVQSLAPRLVRTLDRAVSYSEGVLAYGRAQEPPPRLRRLKLQELVDDVLSTMAVPDGSGIELINAVSEGLEVDADSDQLFRVLSNLTRNAVQAMSGEQEPALVKRLTISAEKSQSIVRIRVMDTGPGLPERARQNLFTAFHGAAKSGGTGLGLAIVQELVRAHGGEIILVESGNGRTVFEIRMPDKTTADDSITERGWQNIPG